MRHAQNISRKNVMVPGSRKNRWEMQYVQNVGSNREIRNRKLYFLILFVIKFLDFRLILGASFAPEY